MYGGRSQIRSNSSALNSVSVLSLPSFIWQKEDATANTGRYLHTCDIVGSRHMLVIGGIITNASVYQLPPDIGNIIGAPSLADTWPQGVGVFDMSDFVWKTSYNASAERYVTPDIVKRAITAGGRYPQTRSDDRIRGWVMREEKESNSSAQSRPGDGGAQSSSSPTSIKTVIGGVVGGIILVSFLIIVYLCVIRRWKKKSPQLLPELTDTRVSEKPGEPLPPQMHSVEKHELSCEMPLREMGSDHGIPELEGESQFDRKKELPKLPPGGKET